MALLEGGPPHRSPSAPLLPAAAGGPGASRDAEGQGKGALTNVVTNAASFLWENEIKAKYKPLSEQITPVHVFLHWGEGDGDSGHG